MKKIISNNTNQKAWRYLYENSMSRGAFDRVAIKSNKKEYTYDQMFRLWKRYAAVFSALAITRKENAKVGIVGSSAPEVIFSIYGLNITGAKTTIIPLQDYLNTDKIISSIQSEGITDLILTDDFLQDKVLHSLFEKKKSLGLNNIILLHSSLTSVTIPKKISTSLNKKNAMRHQMLYCFYIDYLLLKFGDGPIYYDETTKQASIYIHTSGTTSGIGKPIGLSDYSINNICESMSFLKEEYPFIEDDLICPVSIDLSNSFGFVDQVHLTFSYGGTMVSVPGVSLNPLFPKIVEDCKATLLYINGFGLEVWRNYPKEIQFDFSSLKGVVIGGSFVSSKDKKHFNEFFNSHGCKNVPIVVGYGISEFGGVVTIAKPELNNDSIGKLIPGMDALLMDEQSKEFYAANDVGKEGVLYLHSDLINTLDTNEFSKDKLKTINNKTYFCTNDLMCVDKNKELIYLGRCHQYYMNKGIVYQAGRVQMQISKCAGITSCDIVPVYDKFNHDNLPMLCVQTNSKDLKKAIKIVQSALVEVFINKKALSFDQIPYEIMILDHMPHNANGKVDLHAINIGKAKGPRYKVKISSRGNNLKEIKLIEMQEKVSDVWSYVYKQMAKDIVPEPLMAIGESLFDNFADLDSDKLMNMLLKMLREDEKYASVDEDMEISDVFEKHQQFHNFIFQEQQSQFAKLSKQLNDFSNSVNKYFTNNKQKGDQDE